MRTSPPIVSDRTAVREHHAVPARRGRRVVAAALAALLAAAGLSVAAAPAASAAGPTIDAPEIPAAGGDITVTGSGFAPNAPGIYLGVGPAGLSGFYPGSASLLPTQTVWIAVGNAEGGTATQRTSPMNPDGSFSVTLAIPAPSTEVPAYAIYTSKAHGQGFADPSQNTTTSLSYAVASPVQTSLALDASATSVDEGAPVTLTATVSPAAPGEVTFSDGSTTLGTQTVSGEKASLSTSTLGAGSHPITATFAPADTAVFSASTSAAVSVTVVLAPQPASAAVALSPATGLDPDGATIAVTGTGFTPTGGSAMGVYVGVGPASAKNDPGWFVNAGFYQGVKWVRSIGAGGSFSQSLTGITQVFTSDGRSVDCATEECGVYTFAAHGSADRSQDTYTPIAFAAATPQPVQVSLSVDRSSAAQGTEVTYTATVRGAATASGFPGTIAFGEGDGATAPDTTHGSVAVAGDTAVFRTSALPVGAHQVRAWFTPADASDFAAARSDAVATTVTAPATSGPTVTVTPATGIDANAGVLSVTGQAFAASGAGVYLGIGPRAALDDPTWYLNASYFQGAQWISPSGTAGPALHPDGSFSTTLTGVTAAFTANGTAVDCLVQECGVFTFAAHGSTDRSQDTYTPITFAATSPQAVRTQLTIDVPSTSTAGSPVDVRISVSPAADGTVTLYDRGAVVAQSLRVSGSSPLGRAAGPFAAAGPASVVTQVGGLADGSHAFTASFAPDDPSAFSPSVAAAVAHTVQPVGSADTASTSVDSASAQPVCVARSVSGATLDWGVKTSFRTYISGGIANGSWTLSGVGYSGGSFAWSGGTGSVNPSETRGLVRFPGSVAFTGHGGTLNLVLSNIALRVTSANAATLIADVHSTDMGGTPSDATGVSFATVALGGAAASGSALAVNGAATTLTEAGAKAFAGFYAAGTALDPVSFRLPFGASVACDSSTAAAGSALARTGAGGAAEVPLFGGILLLLGVAALAVARRRTRTVPVVR